MRFSIFLLCLFPFSTTFAWESHLGHVDQKYTYTPPDELTPTGTITITLYSINPEDTQQALSITIEPLALALETNSQRPLVSTISTIIQMPHTFISLFQDAIMVAQIQGVLAQIPLSQQMLSILILFYQAQMTQTPLAGPMTVSADYNGGFTIVLGSGSSHSLTVINTPVSNGSARKIEVAHKFGQTRMFNREYQASSGNQTRSSVAGCNPAPVQPTPYYEDDDDEDDRGCVARGCCPWYSWSGRGSSSEREQLTYYRGTSYAPLTYSCFQLLNRMLEPGQGMSDHLWKILPGASGLPVF